MADPLPPPPFEIPLNDDELLLMGRIAVIWGQIDEGFNSTLRWVLKLTPEVFESLLGNQMIGSRLQHLRAAAAQVSRHRAQTLLVQLCEMMTEALPDRNAAMHGCWGHYVLDPSYSNLRVGIYNHQKPKTRFYTDQLSSLYKKLVSILAVLAELSMLSIEEYPEATDYIEQKIYFAPESPDERAAGVWFRRGDKVVRVESIPQGWHSQG